MLTRATFKQRGEIHETSPAKQVFLKNNKQTEL